MHDDLLVTVKHCLCPTNGVAILTFQNHVDNAPLFFEKAETHGLKCFPLAKVSWGDVNRKVSDFDDDDEETYGPIHVWVLHK